MKELDDRFAALFTIGTTAKMLGMSVQAVRLYEHEGFALSAKTESGRRMFSRHDIEKLRCARNMIINDGVSLNGVKKILSLIPCWEYKGGLDKDCETCPAYTKTIGPCWSINDVGSKCLNVDCRSCGAYQLNFKCEEIKETFYKNRLPK